MITVKLNESDKELFSFAQLYFFMAYAAILGFMDYKQDALIAFLIAVCFNVSMLEHYWHTHERFRKELSTSISLPVLKLITISIVSAFSLWFSGVLIEEITWVPASTLSNTVFVLSIVMAIIIYLTLLMFSVELFVIGLMTYILYRAFNNKTVSNPSSMTVLMVFVVPCFALFIYSTKTVFSVNFIKEQLYASYHYNLKPNSNRDAYCNQIPDYTKFKPISTNEVSYVYLISPLGTYKFDKADCNAKISSN